MELQKIDKRRLIKLSWLVLDLIGKDVQVSKGKVAQESNNNNVMSFLIEQAHRYDCDVFFQEEDISYLNDFISLQLSNLRLDRDENADNAHIYKKDTQGLNALLVMLISVFDSYFTVKEE